MIGPQETGHVPGIEFSTAPHEGVTVAVAGRRKRLAVIDDDGSVIAAGVDVALEVRAVAVNSYRAFLEAGGHMRIRLRPAGGD